MSSAEVVIGALRVNAVGISSVFQGLKRIMTQAQTVFPTDPSRSFMFEPIHH